VTARLTVSYRLNAHGVDARHNLDSTFEHEGVDITVTARRSDEESFASIECSGTVELNPDAASIERAQGKPNWQIPIETSGRFYFPSGDDAMTVDGLGAALERVDAALRTVGAVIRWRFRLAGRDQVFSDAHVELALANGGVTELRKSPYSVIAGDDMAVVREPGWSELAGLMASGLGEPLGHQLLREAWNLRESNPRSSLVIAVTAAEVGIKQLIADLVPHARSLVEDLPAPPLMKIVSHTLPELPIRADVDPGRRCPKHLRSALELAVQERNKVVHRGASPTTWLRPTLVTIREFLYLLDLYAGHQWAAGLLSEQSRNATGLRDF
jgi:hypothetical protein